MGKPGTWSNVDLDVSKYLSLQNSPYESLGSDVELSSLPRSRAPSHGSRLSSLHAEDSLDPLVKEIGVRSFETPTRQTEEPADAGQSTTAVDKKKRHRLQGWRFGVAASTLLAFVVLLANVLFILIASIKYSVTGSIGTLFDGDCHYVEQTTVWLHVAINVLSSLLLSASNYTMQALCSPTRKEVDVAHARGDWLDIGVPSVRNVFGRIAKRRIAMWWVLGLSSVPIHLLYNSAIFKTIDANEYTPMVVRPAFLEPGSRALNATDMGFQVDPSYPYYADDLKTIQIFFMDNADTENVKRLSNHECISLYGSTFVSGFSDVLLITEDGDGGGNHTILWAAPGYYDPTISVRYDWICADGSQHGKDSSCDPAQVKQQASTWTVHGNRVQYCLAHVMPVHCKLQFSQTILAIVIIMNCAKFLAMGWTYRYQKSTTLVTIGDAISDFLIAPDPMTTSQCLVTKKDIVDYAPHGQSWNRVGAHVAEGLGNTAHAMPLPYTEDLRRWRNAASTKRWNVTILLVSLALVGTGVLLGIGTQNSNLRGPAQAFNLGFGKLDPRLMVEAGLPTSGGAALTAAVLLANTPQAICSLLYLAYNGLFTCMLLSQEWSGYYVRPKALRVTDPHGQQRSKYYLQLPFTYSVPLLAASAGLHWLISESIFLARVDFYSGSSKSDRPTQSMSKCGYSPMAILIVLLLGTVMLSVLLGHTFRRFSSPMPVVSSCSLAIASACHPPTDDEDAAYLPVAWGDVDPGEFGEVGHCTFTSHQVSAPVHGRMYAGNRVALDAATEEIRS